MIGTNETEPYGYWTFNVVLDFERVQSRPYVTSVTVPIYDTIEYMWLDFNRNPSDPMVLPLGLSLFGNDLAKRVSFSAIAQEVREYYFERPGSSFEPGIENEIEILEITC